MNYLADANTDQPVTNDTKQLGHLPMNIALQAWDIAKEFYTHESPHVIGEALQLINKHLHVNTDKYMYGHIILKPQDFYSHLAAFYATDARDIDSSVYTQIMLYLEIVVKMQAE